MASSLDDKEDYKAGKKTGVTVQPTPFLESLHWEQEKPDFAEATLPFADLPTLALPVIHVDDIHTQFRLKSIVKSPLSTHTILDNYAISEQPTWIIPVLRETRLESSVESEDQTKGSGGYLSIIRNLITNSGIYAISSVAVPLVSLVLAPFLTRYLSHTEYGTLVIINTFVALLAGVTQLGLGDAFPKAYCFDYETAADKRNVLSSIVMMLIFISMPSTCLIFLAAPWIATVLLNSPALDNFVRLAALVVLLQNLSVPGLVWLRAENKAIRYSLLSVTNLLMVLGLNIVLVGIVHMGIYGSLIATGSGYAMVVLITLPVIMLRAGFLLRLDIAKGMLAFGTPHVINLLSGWVLQLSDRYLIGHLGSLAQTASYAVAYSLGGMLSAMVITPFSLAWWTLMFPIAKRKDAPQVFRLIFRWFSLLLLLATFAFSLVAIVALYMLFPIGYRAAASIIPIIAVSIMFNGIFVVVAVGTSITRKTWLVAIFITISAVLNVGLNLVLIPLYGSMGAAYATLIAYVVLMLVTYIANQFIYPLPFEMDLFLIALIIGIALYAGADLLAQPMASEIAWSIRIVTLLLYTGILAVLGKHYPVRR